MISTHMFYSTTIIISSQNILGKIRHWNSFIVDILGYLYMWMSRVFIILVSLA